MIVAGTGHRPDKLGGYTTAVRGDLEHLAIEWLSAHPEVEHVISGGALGWDQALARAAQLLKIPYTMALPFPGFEDRWPKESKQALYALMHDASRIKYVCDAGYAGWKMQERNKWMVDNSDTILALWNGTPGGTANCVSYAQQKRKPIVNLWDEYK